jgi:hypothetical protein
MDIITGGDCIVRYKHTMTGPKTFEQWVEAYEERGDCEFVLSQGEKVCWHPEHGFFTCLFDAASGEILIPKMCGDGKYWRPLIYGLAVKGREKRGVKGVLCCTKRNPAAFTRLMGGTLRRMEYSYDFATGKGRALWFIFISWDDTKEGRNEKDDHDFSFNIDSSAGAAWG